MYTSNKFSESFLHDYGDILKELFQSITTDKSYGSDDITDYIIRWDEVFDNIKKYIYENPHNTIDDIKFNDITHNIKIIKSSKYYDSETVYFDSRTFEFYTLSIVHMFYNSNKAYLKDVKTNAFVTLVDSTKRFIYVGQCTEIRRGYYDRKQ